jgi:hypothetical protein
MKKEVGVEVDLKVVPEVLKVGIFIVEKVMFDLPVLLVAEFTPKKSTVLELPNADFEFEEVALEGNDTFSFTTVEGFVVPTFLGVFPEDDLGSPFTFGTVIFVIPAASTLPCQGIKKD